MNKTVVKVESETSENGIVIPKSITWVDGRKWQIDRVIHSCSSVDYEFEGIRYTVKIGSAEKYLYQFGDTWYVEAS